MGAEIATLVDEATDPAAEELCRQLAARDLIERLPTWTGDWLTLTPDQRLRLLGLVRAAAA